MNFMNRKRSTSSKEVSNQSSTEKRNFVDESHQMTLNQPFSITEDVLSTSYSSIEYHLTAQITNNSLTQRDLSLLLDVFNYQVVHYGINFNMMLAMYELYFRILGKKSSVFEISNERIRLTLTVTELILKIFKNFDFSLDSKSFALIPDNMKKILVKGVMSKRTYGSRYKTWRPEKFITIKAVPVDILFLKRKENTQPYSGYCKGYGESHPSAHKQKLRPSSEYDGEEIDLELQEELKLFTRCTNPIHLLSEYLLIRYNNELETEQ
jgi:hypothetical protein